MIVLESSRNDIDPNPMETHSGISEVTWQDIRCSVIGGTNGGGGVLGVVVLLHGHKYKMDLSILSYLDMFGYGPSECNHAYSPQHRGAHLRFNQFAVSIMLSDKMCFENLLSVRCKQSHQHQHPRLNASISAAD